MSKGKGHITINGKDMKEYFPVDTMQFKLEQPYNIGNIKESMQHNYKKNIQ